MKKQETLATVDTKFLTVDYYRKRFDELLAGYEGLKVLHKLLAERDPQFEGLDGWNRLCNIKRHIAGKDLTADAVKMMEEMAPSVTSSRLSRQKLTPMK